MKKRPIDVLENIFPFIKEHRSSELSMDVDYEGEIIRISLKNVTNEKHKD